jgi:hypothetical protein
VTLHRPASRRITPRHRQGYKLLYLNCSSRAQLLEIVCWVPAYATTRGRGFSLHVHDCPLGTSRSRQGRTMRAAGTGGGGMRNDVVDGRRRRKRPIRFVGGLVGSGNFSQLGCGHFTQPGNECTHVVQRGLQPPHLPSQLLGLVTAHHGPVRHRLRLARPAVRRRAPRPLPSCRPHSITLSWNWNQARRTFPPGWPNPGCG